MAWERRRLAAGCAGALTAALGLAACVTAPPSLTQPAAGNASPWDSITATRAGYVRLMLSNYMGMGALGEGSLDQVVQGYGGGYVLSVSASGSAYTGTEQHAVNVVLGVTPVQDHMQGEGYFGLAAAECYQYRIGYYPYLVSYVPIGCPAPGSPVIEQRDAGEWAAGLATAQFLFSGEQPGAVPASLAQAETVLAPIQRRAAAQAGSVRPAGQENPSDFAVGTQRQPSRWYGTAVAALAVPLSNGTCGYVDFSYAIENDGTRRLSFTGTVSPWHAACTGQAALAATVPFSGDPGAGG